MRKYFRFSSDRSELEKAQILYGVQVLWHNIKTTVIIFVVSLLLDALYGTFWTFLSFGMFRMFAGGLHLNTSVGCLLTTGSFGRLSYISSVAVDLDLLSNSYRRCTVCTAGNSEQSIFRRRSEKNEKTFHSSRLDLCSHFHIRNRKDQLLDYDRSNRRADHCYYFICSEKRSQETGIVKRCSKI